MSRPDHAWGAVRPVMLGILATTMLLIGFLGWTMTARIAGAVVVRGQVEVDQNRQTLQHPDGGVVDAILVTDGDRVAVGQPLLRLEGAFLLSEQALVEGQFLEALARQGRLEAERDGGAVPIFRAPPPGLSVHPPEAQNHFDGQARLLEARARTFAHLIEQLERRQDQARAQLAGLMTQRAALTRERGLLLEELAGQEQLLEQGLVQAARVVALQRDLARLDGREGALAAEAAQVEGRITEIGLEIVTRDAARREAAEAELLDLGIRLMELAERRRVLAERILRLELRAPVAGIVHGLSVNTPRAVLRPAEPVMQIVPSDRPLVLAVRVAPTDIDHVFIGQEVTVLIHAQTHGATPELRGTVARVSGDAFHDERAGLSHFRVEIALETLQHRQSGAPMLMPGMQAEAFLRTRERTPMEYLTQPLTDHFRRAFRES